MFDYLIIVGTITLTGTFNSKTRSYDELIRYFVTTSSRRQYDDPQIQVKEKKTSPQKYKSDDH